MSLERVRPGERRNHPGASEAPPFYWQQGPYGATAAGTTDRRLFVPGTGAIEPRVALWIRDGGGWRRLSPLNPRDVAHARAAMDMMQTDIMERYLSDLNRRTDK